MQIQYSFMGNIEPTDEQLHLLMQEVVVDVTERAKKSNEQFFKNLQMLVNTVREKQLRETTDNDESGKA